jgi:hypothetical protein
VVSGLWDLLRLAVAVMLLLSGRALRRLASKIIG